MEVITITKLGLSIIDVVLFVFILILTILVVMQNLKLKKFLRGKKTETLEGTIVLLQKEVSVLNTARNTVDEYLKKVENRLKKSVQKIETIRYNPFKSSGGGQSFTTAILSEDGDGVIISTLHSRDRMSIFGKPVKNFSSEHKLSDEELEAIKRIRGNRED